MIEQLKIKNKYHLKEAQIELRPFTPGNYAAQIKERVIPAVIELESKGLINGFYFLRHSKIDFRISCDSWDKNEKEIKRVLAKHQIPDNLKEYDIQENAIANLDNNSLEFTSRLRMAYLLLEEKRKEQIGYDMLKKFPQLWIHYLYNQFGYNNLDEAIDHFNSSINQLFIALEYNQCTVQNCIQYLEEFKRVADEQINKLKKKK